MIDKIDKTNFFKNLFILGVVGLLIFPVNLLIGKLLFVFENPDINFIALQDGWIGLMTDLMKFAIFFPAFIGICFITASIIYFLKLNKN
ncbi:TPA: hypothetical protein ACKONR_000407 [Clostridioides difficile]|uniref:hypothetical protein n=1 Tax=Clostridioides difficile TaxID=1496 RepID=UPI000824ECE2|nr:hypothetical protein [Clostridioides difficile]MDV9854124.1 hypothetical protein [Clostridioides difficile]TGA17822.1 hypothetical protein E5F39_12300 [Clostridioides difficile]TGA44237.1 hypothetical protein E5F32_20565 [Clostridioides difficile]HBE9726982.1 hypothetical protein [Clostridioides difficile]HBF1102457.1 hypothetical protein [Clostridioides difficile]